MSGRLKNIGFVLVLLLVAIYLLVGTYFQLNEMFGRVGTAGVLLGLLLGWMATSLYYYPRSVSRIRCLNCGEEFTEIPEWLGTTHGFHRLGKYLCTHCGYQNNHELRPIPKKNVIS